MSSGSDVWDEETSGAVDVQVNNRALHCGEGQGSVQTTHVPLNQA